MGKRADVIVVGGGASGMFVAIECARKGQQVLLFEHKRQLGKKLLATGNGKCNFTNKKMDAECFRSDNPEFVKSGLKQFGAEETIEFFRKLGIEPKQKEGYVYPYSEQAAAVLEVFEMELKRLQVDVVYEQVVVVENTGRFLVKTQENSYAAKHVVLATGGKASAKLGSDGSGYRMAKKLGHTMVSQVPALIGLKCAEAYYEDIAGVRMQAEVALYIDDETNATVKECGELQLTKYGISGIPVFQISRFAAKALLEGKNVVAKIDYMPGFTKQELEELLKERFSSEYKTAQEAMVGLLNKKLIPVFLQQSGIKGTKIASQIKEQQIIQLAQQLKNKKTQVIDTNGFEQAQVTAGGVDTKEIDELTMESKKVKGLYFTGEIMDVDGICGGYNLQWCWTSGYLAAKAICNGA